MTGGYTPETTGKTRTMNNIKEKQIFLIFIALAVFVFGCATGQDREMADSHITIGTAYLKAGQFSPALREFLTAQNLSPRDPEICYHAGLAYYGSGLKKEARGQFERAVSIKSDYSEAYNYLGTIYLEEGLYENAIKSFEKALSNMLYETPSIALNNIGWAYFKKGDYTTALIKYETAIKREPNTPILPIIQKNMGITYLELHNIDEAIYYLDKSIASAPEITESHYWLGISHLERGNKEKAIGQLRLAAKTSPESEFAIKARKKLSSILQE